MGDWYRLTKRINGRLYGLLAAPLKNIRMLLDATIKVARQRSKEMPDHFEIDPAVVTRWVEEAKLAVKHFLHKCEAVEYTAEAGFNIMAYASAQSAQLRQQLMALEKRADALQYRKPSS